jgi:dTDP-4-dehydrorhamnose reductase
MKILLFGASGQVGWELRRSLTLLGHVTAATRDSVDLEKPSQLESFARHVAPDLIVNAAAYTAVDKAEAEPEKARRVNADAPAILSRVALERNCWLVHYSTDYVFDGTKSSPYREDDETGPLGTYGATKAEGEREIRRSGCRHLIFRTSWVYGTLGANFPRTMLRLARERDSLKVVADQMGAPTSAELIADVTAMCLYMLQKGDACVMETLSGTYHLAAAGETTWHEYAQYVVQLAIEHGMHLKASPADVHPIATAQYPLPAARPPNSRLNCDRLGDAFGLHLPDWRVHVARFVSEYVALESK